MVVEQRRQQLPYSHAILQCIMSFVFIVLFRREREKSNLCFVRGLLHRHLFFVSDRFCRRHRLRTGENIPSIPRDLLLMSEMVLPRFILCIIQYLRDGYVEPGKITHNSILFTKMGDATLIPKKFGILRKM